MWSTNRANITFLGKLNEMQFQEVESACSSWKSFIVFCCLQLGTSVHVCHWCLSSTVETHADQSQVSQPCNLRLSFRELKPCVCLWPTPLPKLKGCRCGLTPPLSAPRSDQAKVWACVCLESPPTLPLVMGLNGSHAHYCPLVFLFSTTMLALKMATPVVLS